jgi:hypothetical protein
MIMTFLAPLAPVDSPSPLATKSPSSLPAENASSDAGLFEPAFVDGDLPGCPARPVRKADAQRCLRFCRRTGDAEGKRRGSKHGSKFKCPFHEKTSQKKPRNWQKKLKNRRLK